VKIRQITRHTVIGLTAVLTLGSAVACSSPAPAPTAPVAPTVAPVPSQPAPAALLAWGAKGDGGGADVTLGQPVRGADGIAVYDVTITNRLPDVLDQLSTDDITADGLGTDAANDTVENNPGFQLGILQGKTLTYKVHLANLPATAKNIIVTVNAHWTNGSANLTKLVWSGAVK
jgi:hypothetical protein